jgi:hypothetical protein
MILRSRCVDGFRDVYNLVEGGLDADSALDYSVPKY